MPLMKIGWILLAFGIFLGIGGIIFFTETDAGKDMLESLICADNESLTIESATGAQGESTLSVGCIKNDGGAPVDVTGKLFLVIGVLLLPVLLSSPVLLIGIMGTRRKTENQPLRGG